MSFRRFLDRGYSLRRIDTSRFFFSQHHPPTAEDNGQLTPLDSAGGGGGATDPSAVDGGGRLPDPVINLCPHRKGPMAGQIGFVLFDNDKVVAIDRSTTPAAASSATWPAFLPPSTTSLPYLPSTSGPSPSPPATAAASTSWKRSPRAGDGRRLQQAQLRGPLPWSMEVRCTCAAR
ncbi:unnamed protein product [Urochloa humidicola]